MRAKQFYFTIGIIFLLVTGSACSVSYSTANISSLKMGKEKPVGNEVRTFAPEDTIYATAVIANNPGTVKVKGQMIIEDVAGQQPGPIPGLEVTVEMPNSGDANFTFTPNNPWPAGKYKFDAVMLDENGQQKDQKTVSFSVS
jgi:hypothetical protein